MEKELRRQQSILSASGTAVALFGVWSVVKTILFAFLGPSNMNIPKDTANPMEEALSKMNPADLEIFVLIVLGIALVVMVVDLALRLYVGFSARAEAKGKKKSVVYLVFVVISLILSVLSVISLLQTTYVTSPLDSIASIVVEATSAFSLISLFVASVRLRKLRKQLRQ